MTSRNRLTGLITRHGTHPLHLDTLDDTEANILLAKRLGAARTGAEGQAVADLIKLCGGYPLALSLIAGRARSHPQVPLAEFANELRESGMEALDDLDPIASLPAVLSLSVADLTTEQRQVFALLGMAPGVDVGLHAAGSLAALSLPQTGKVLHALEVGSHISRKAHSRYTMHDLIRSYAANYHMAPGTREAALRRVLDFYLHTAYTADRLLDPNREPIRLDAPATGVHIKMLHSIEAALAWFDTEYPNLLAAQHIAIAHGQHRTVWQIAWSVATFHDRRGHVHDRLAVWTAALDAAAYLPDPTTRMLAHRYLGISHADLGSHEDAMAQLRSALALAEYHHDPTQQAYAHEMLAGALEKQGDDQRSLEHATRALRLYETIGRPMDEADAHTWLSLAAARLGDYDTARTHCQSALSLHRLHNDPTGMAATLSTLGYVDHQTGHHRRALAHYQQSLTLYRALGHAYQTANTLDYLGRTYIDLDQPEQARAVWQEAMELYLQQGRDEGTRRVRQQVEILGGVNSNRLLP